MDSRDLEALGYAALFVSATAAGVSGLARLISWLFAVCDAHTRDARRRRDILDRRVELASARGRALFAQRAGEAGLLPRPDWQAIVTEMRSELDAAEAHLDAAEAELGPPRPWWRARP